MILSRVIPMVLFWTYADSLGLRSKTDLGPVKIHHRERLTLQNDWSDLRNYEIDWTDLYDNLDMLDKIVENQRGIQLQFPLEIGGSGNPRRCSLHNVSKIHEECLTENSNIFEMRNDRDYRALLKWSQGETEPFTSLLTDTQLLVRAEGYKKIVFGDEIMSAFLDLESVTKPVTMLRFKNETTLSATLTGAIKTLCCIRVPSLDIGRSMKMLEQVRTGLKYSAARLGDEFDKLIRLNRTEKGKEEALLGFHGCEEFSLLTQQSQRLSTVFIDAGEIDYLKELRQAADACYLELSYKTIDVIYPRDMIIERVEEVHGKSRTNGKLVLTAEYLTSTIDHYEVKRIFEATAVDVMGMPSIRYIADWDGNSYGVQANLDHRCRENSGKYTCESGSLVKCDMDIEEPKVLSRETNPRYVIFEISRPDYDSCYRKKFNNGAEPSGFVIHNPQEQKNMTVQARCPGSDYTLELMPLTGIMHECPVKEISGIAILTRKITKAVSKRFDGLETWLDSYWFKLGMLGISILSFLVMYSAYRVRQNQYRKLRSRVDEASTILNSKLDDIDNAVVRGLSRRNRPEGANSIPMNPMNTTRRS